MVYSDFSGSEREEVVRRLREHYGLKLSVEDLNDLLRGKVLDLPPEVVRVKKVSMRVQQPLLVIEVEMEVGKIEVQIPLFLELIPIRSRAPL